MITTQGNFVIIGANTDDPQVFLGGQKIEGLRDLRADKPRVKLKLDAGANPPETIAALRAVGIIVKECRDE